METSIALYPRVSLKINSITLLSFTCQKRVLILVIVLARQKTSKLETQVESKVTIDKNINTPKDKTDKTPKTLKTPKTPKTNKFLKTPTTPITPKNLTMPMIPKTPTQSKASIKPDGSMIKTQSKGKVNPKDHKKTSTNTTTISGMLMNYFVLDLLHTD